MANFGLQIDRKKLKKVQKALRKISRRIYRQTKKIIRKSPELVKTSFQKFVPSFKKWCAEIKLRGDWMTILALFLFIISLSTVHQTQQISKNETIEEETQNLASGHDDKTEDASLEIPKESHSKTEELQKLLREKYAHLEIGIFVQDLVDRSKTVSVNSDREFITASTYKMFAAYSMYKSNNVPECIRVMIVNSDNACPINYMQGEDGNSGYGWTRMMKDVQELGLKNTKTTTEANFSTAEDEALFLTLFYDGKLSPPMDRDFVLELMESQVHRRGIPAGVGRRGDVADKVGMINALVHDAAIVFSQEGDYVEVIMTDNESWERVAEIAKTVEEFMHP